MRIEIPMPRVFSLVSIVVKKANETKICVVTQPMSIRTIAFPSMYRATWEFPLRVEMKFGGWKIRQCKGSAKFVAV